MFTEDQQAKIKELIDYSNANPISFERLRTMEPFGETKHHITVGDFRIVFTVEQQPEPLGDCLHMSLSKNNKPPELSEIAEVSGMFGFDGDVVAAVCPLIDYSLYARAYVLASGNTSVTAEDFHPDPNSDEMGTCINIMKRIDTKAIPEFHNCQIPPPFKVMIDSTQFGAGGCEMCSVTIDDDGPTVKYPTADSTKHYYPTHTYGLITVKQPELFIAATSFGGGKRTGQLLNIVWTYFHLNPMTLIEVIRDGKCMIDRDFLKQIPGHMTLPGMTVLSNKTLYDYTGDVMCRIVPPSFGGVIAGFSDHHRKLSEVYENEYIQIYSPDEPETLESEFYIGKEQ